MQSVHPGLLEANIPPWLENSPKELGKSTCYPGSNPKIYQGKASLNNVSVCNFNPLKTGWVSETEVFSGALMLDTLEFMVGNSIKSPCHSMVENDDSQQSLSSDLHTCSGAYVYLYLYT